MRPPFAFRICFVSFCVLLVAITSCGDHGSEPVGSAPESGGAGADQGGAGGASDGVIGPAGGVVVGGGGVGMVDGVCRPVKTHLPIPQRTEALKEQPLDTFGNLAAQVELQCGNCHKAPAQQGAFSFTGSAQNLCDVRGKGPKAKGQSIADVMLSGYMPFMIGGQEALGQKVRAWMEQGCPGDAYQLPGEGTVIQSDFRTTADVGGSLTDLGNCVPEPEFVGEDANTDALFAKAGSFEQLPVSLFETDMRTLDSAELARHGTFAYSPTYPLWSDDARKLRYVHVPAGQAIRYDQASQQFIIPKNTRFYKTFLREVVEGSGQSRWRKMETRLIVVRGSGADALYATYVWNAEETGAKRLGSGLDPAAPDKPELYLNGEPFPDYVYTYAKDDGNPDDRASYAVPGAQRCVACHVGSLNDSFILGFTPTQMKHRAAGEGGVYEDVLPDELGQLARLESYGVTRGVDESNLVDLEDSALPREPRTRDELNMQAYMVGNCAHCHNPRGYAVRSASGLAWLNMAPGGAVFGFNMSGTVSGAPRELDGQSFYFADAPAPNSPAEPESINIAQLRRALFRSGFLRRTLAPTQVLEPEDFQSQLGISPQDDSRRYMNLHMPLHTSGVDCRLPKLAARWWGSVPRAFRPDFPETDSPTETELARASSLADKAGQWAAQECEHFAEKGIPWVLEDASERYPYVERNIDWRSSKDPSKRPPAWLKELELTEAHEALAKKSYHLGYFDPGCDFPAEGPASQSPEPWMLDYQTGKNDHPWGQVYTVTPGEHIYAAICSNCHGVNGDAQTGAARVIRYTSGARVASFVDGLFGPRRKPSQNLAAFDELTTQGPADAPDAALGPNGAAKYLVWMAYGGTHVSFGRTEEEEQTFLKTFVSYRSIGRNPIPLNPISAPLTFTSAKANMLQVAWKVCSDLRGPPDAASPIKLWDAAVQSGDEERGTAWTIVLQQRQAFGTGLWRDVCQLNNPLTPEIVNAPADSPEVLAWLDRAVFNAGVMAYLYMRDELSRGVRAPAYDQCDLRYPRKAGVSADL